MKIIIKCLVGVCLFLVPIVNLSAQTVIHIAEGGNVYIQQNASISFDSLVLTPSADVLLSATDIAKSATVMHAATGNYIGRVYSFSTPVTNYAGSATIVYKDDELNGLDENSLLLEAFTNNHWQAFTNNISRNTIANYVTTTGLTNITLDELTLASNNSVLALQWISVQASRENNVSYIKWTTANKVNAEYYQVLKSSDAITWTKIGKPIAASNHSGLNDYNFTDAAVLNGTAYYRIFQMDDLGKISYSTVVSVASSLQDEFSIYPIPAVSIINVLVKENSAIKYVKLFDASGKLLMVKEGNNGDLYSFAISSLASGYYFVSIETSAGQLTKGFLKK